MISQDCWKDMTIRNTAPIMTESIIKYTGHITESPVFEVIYKSWKDEENYNPSNPNIHVAIIEQIGSGITIGPRVLKEELRRKGLDIRGSEIDAHLDYLRSKRLVTWVERAKGRAYKLDQDGKNFYEWIHKKNEIQQIQPSYDLNDGQNIFEDILGLCKGKKKLPRDKEYCKNPFVATLKYIKSINKIYVRRDHILNELERMGFNLDRDDLTEILNFLTGRGLIREGRRRNRMLVKEYAINNTTNDLLSYVKENCKDR